MKARTSSQARWRLIAYLAAAGAAVLCALVAFFAVRERGADAARPAEGAVTAAQSAVVRAWVPDDANAAGGSGKGLPMPASGAMFPSTEASIASPDFPENMNLEPIVVLETNQGAIELKLMPLIAPKACENFIGLAKKGYYDGVVFHRVIKSFMVQGGDPTGTGMGGESIWGKDFKDECSPDVKFTKKGLLAMANAGPNTNGSQFFITTTTTPWLHMRHTIFGEVVTGYDVVEKIENTKTDPSDRPIEKQYIKRAWVKDDAPAKK